MTDATSTPDRPADQLRAVVDVLDDAELYLSVLHGAVGRHDHIGADLTCGGCALRDRMTPALAVARQLLGTTSKTTAAAPLPEVWTVWREDEPVYGHFATVEAARQGTIDCWQDDEPVCPDYSWRPDGPRLELVVGGEFSGVYASRHRVYGAPPAPADRAAVLEDPTPVSRATTLSELADEQTQLAVADDLGRRRGMVTARRQFVTDLRRLAGEAAAGAHQTETAHRPGRCPVMIPGGGRCEKNADHQAGQPNDPHTPIPAVPAAPEETTR
ncbi:hypothetical protein [Streptomyces anulatus]|uniref:hypothetical protein n=1 Tax=Streptomyces anulatus TaxID=1892 RepID=UPI00344916CF